jgi:dynein heavy chain, axonemal
MDSIFFVASHLKIHKVIFALIYICFRMLGASLDRRSGKLIESKPKVLYEQMPIIYIYAINTTAGKDPKLYECPIYRKPQRTDQKYVGSIDFETDLSPRHWTLRGVALLCDIK